MAYTNDAQLNDDFQRQCMDATAEFAKQSLATDETVYADADDLVFNGPADVDDEEDDLEHDEDLEEDDEDDEEDDLDEDDVLEDEDDEDEEDLDDEDEYEDDDEDEGDEEDDEE